MKIYLIPLILISLHLLTGCEKILIGDDPQNKPLENFELLWRTVDEKYSFFTYKNIDWDSVYDAYRPRVKDDMSQRELFSLLAEMMNVLRDGHVNLTSPFDVSRNWDWFLDHPQNFNATVLERSYLGKDYEITGPFINKKFGEVGYIYYGSFMSGFTDSQITYLIDKFKDCKGIIIDIRNNGGGRIDLIPRLTSFFTDEKRTTGYTRYKDGPGHDEFTEFYPQEVEPAEKRFEQPVVLLTNRSVYSAANAFASFMSTLPNVILMGDRTGGGGGAPYSGELMNGWRFRFSTTQMVNPAMEQIENGIPVDIEQDILVSDEAHGVDSILERAFDHLNE